MTEEEKPKKRTITIEIEEESDGTTIQVSPSFGRVSTMIEDFGLAVGHVFGQAARNLNGIKNLVEIHGEKVMRVSFDLYAQREGKDKIIIETLMHLVNRGRALALSPKDLPEELKEKLNGKCKSCEKLECPLAGKGITDEAEAPPECLH